MHLLEVFEFQFWGDKVLVVNELLDVYFASVCSKEIIPQLTQLAPVLHHCIINTFLKDPIVEVIALLGSCVHEVYIVTDIGIDQFIKDLVVLWGMEEVVPGESLQ